MYFQIHTFLQFHLPNIYSSKAVPCFSQDAYYLHSERQPDWGGQLRLQDKHDQWHIIEPSPNRLAIFQSDLLHEVLPAKQQRLSSTAWLRSGNALW